MPNAAQLQQFLAQSQYLPDGVAAALESVARYLPLDAERGDTLAIAAYASEFTTSDALIVDSGAGSRPLAVAVESRGTSCFLRMYNLSTTSTLTGSGSRNPDFIVPVATATGEVTAVSMQGASWEGFWTAGLCLFVSTNGANAHANPANVPRVYLLYRNA